jgi:hypothetical protein
MKLPHRLATVARTVARLRPGQVAWRAVHVARLLACNHIEVLGALRARPDATARAASLPVFEIAGIDARPGELWRQGIVEYHGIQAARDDWKGEAQSKLWRYERQYHSELVSLAAASVDEARALVDDWIAHNPPCRGDAWEPYPVARRLLNWSLAAAIAPALRSHLAPWMAGQMRFLAAHLERHLLGNHLLCDLCAVVAAAASLEVPDSESLGARAARQLERELCRQVLPDGGYAERTAQYHLWVLHDALLALALHQSRGRSLNAGAVLARMLRWMDWVRRSEGVFPWLNDAAPDGLPSLPVMRALARIAGVVPAAGLPPATIELPDTGWTIIREGGHELLFEHGIIGPEHQPGHGHADALSFELLWDGVPVITDTGVTTYAPGDLRTFERSAGAHATVQVDGQGSDEPWASFRVGGRARPAYLGKSSPWPGSWLLRGQVTSYRGWLHRRGLLFWPGHVLIVGDELLRVPPGAAIVSTLPLAPNWNVTIAPDGCHIDSENRRLELLVLQGRLLEAVRGEYPACPGWVGCGFGRGRGRVSLSLGPNQNGRILHVIAAPNIHVSEHDGMLMVVAGEIRQQLPIVDLLP